MLNLKKYKSLLFMLTGVASLFTSQLVSASNNVTMCNYCTDFQMQTEALKATAVGGKVHVVDMKTGKVKAYHVEREQNLVMISDDIVDHVVQGAVDESRLAAQIVSSILSGRIDFSTIQPHMTSSQINSAYQLSRSIHARHQVARAMAQYLEESLSGTIVTAIAALGQQRVNAAFPANLTVPVSFPDGTTYNFTFKGLEATGTDVSALFEPKVDSGRDGTLEIPEGLDYAWFEGSGSTESMERTILWMRFQGVEVTSVAGGTIVSCSFSDTTLLCRVRK